MTTAVKEHGLLMTGPNVRRIFAGLKDQTRRPVTKHNSAVDTGYAFECFDLESAWVDESWLESAGYSFLKADMKQATLDLFELEGTSGYRIHCRWKPGDLIWVRETWARVTIQVDDDDKPHFQSSGRHDFADDTIYRADCHEDDEYQFVGPWISPLHMPREECRLWLEVKRLRAERLQEISEEDVEAESFNAQPDLNCYAAEFAITWDAIYAKSGYSWEANPWVWVVELERAERP